METDNTLEMSQKRSGILYPVMLIAAIAVIVFSAAGIATMMGWMPSAQSKIEPPAKAMPEAARPAASRPRAVAFAPAACADCGVVESIRAVEVKSEGSGVGAIGGAVVGAGAGAYAGHEIEKNVKKSVSYQVRVRMNDGTYRTFHERAQPALAIGQKVRVTERGVIAAG